MADSPKTPLPFAIGCLFFVGALVAFVVIFTAQLGSSDSQPPPRPTPQPTSTVLLPAPTLALLQATALQPTAAPSVTTAPTPPPVQTETPTGVPVATPTVVPTPTLVPSPRVPRVVSTTDLRPTPTLDLSPQTKTYFPVVHVAPTPTEIEVYRYALMSWIFDLQVWADDLIALFDRGLTTTSPEWIAGLNDLEQRLDLLTTTLQTLDPPYGYINAQEILLVGMDACSYAIRYYKESEFSYANLYLTTCTFSIEMAHTKMIFAPTK